MIEISTAEDKEYVCISVGGEVDASSSIQLDTTIQNAVSDGYKKIMIDCSGLNYISSAGLGVFMSYIQALEIKEINMVIFGLQDKVFHVFQILGLDQLLKIVDDEKSAKGLLNVI